IAINVSPRRDPICRLVVPLENLKHLPSRYDVTPATGQDAVVIESLIDSYRDGKYVPPIAVRQCDLDHCDLEHCSLADGNHRFHAARRIGLARIDCDILPLALWRIADRERAAKRWHDTYPSRLTRNPHV